MLLLLSKPISILILLKNTSASLVLVVPSCTLIIFWRLTLIIITMTRERIAQMLPKVFTSSISSTSYKRNKKSMLILTFGHTMDNLRVVPLGFGTLRGVGSFFPHIPLPIIIGNISSFWHTVFYLIFHYFLLVLPAIVVFFVHRLIYRGNFDSWQEDLLTMKETDLMGPGTRAEFNRRKLISADPAQENWYLGKRPKFDFSNIDEILQERKSDQLKIARARFGA